MESNQKNRGFAAMDRSRQIEIARKGGKAAHQKGTAHEFTADEARAAGRKGGETVSANRGHMSQIGRIGGKKSAGRKKQAHPQQPIMREIKENSGSHEQEVVESPISDSIGAGESEESAENAA